MEQDSQFLLNCSNLTEQNLLSINLAATTSGMVSFIISTLIVAFLVFYKTFTSVLQRLFLYLMIATTLTEMGRTLSIEHQLHYQGQEEVCVWLGFFYNYTGVVVFVFTVGIMVYLLCLISCLARGITTVAILHPKWRRITLECTYVILSLLLSLVYAWVPYINHNYGLAGAWCWIRTFDKNCTAVGLIDQIMNGYFFYVTTGVLGLVKISVIVIMYCKLSPSLREVRVLLKKTFIILLCLLVYIGLIMFALVLRSSTAKVEEYRYFILWLLITITFPLSQLLFPIGFLFCFYSVNKLKWKSIKKAAGEWTTCCITWTKCCASMRKARRYTVRFNPDVLTQAPTVPASTRVSPPSSTFYNVSYTNNFTHITSTDDNKPLIPEKCTDTGYNSVSH